LFVVTASPFVQMNHMALTPKSREVWHEISGIPLNDVPNLDASEHVGLLTVIAGISQLRFFLTLRVQKSKGLCVCYDRPI
jgi:hypothetical protein